MVTNKKIGSEVIYETKDFLVVIPHSYESMIYYGSNTDWDVIQGNGEYFYNEYYKLGPLYIIIDKTTNMKFLFHFETEDYINQNNDNILFDLYEELLPIVGKIMPTEELVVETSTGDGLIDRNGNWLLEPIYDDILKPNNDNLRKVSLNGVVKTIDKNFNII